MTEATQHDPAPAARPPGRSLATLALIIVCLAAAVGGYLFEANRAAPVVTPSPPPAAMKPPPPTPAPVAAKTPAPVQQAQAQQSVAHPAAPKPAAPPPSAPKAALLRPAVAPLPAAPLPTVPKTVLPPPAAPPKPAAPLPPPPNVDVVRLDEYGSLVMAGRGQPGETLTVHNGVTALGTVTVDADGQWVFLPDATLPSGIHQLSVADVKAPANDTAAQTTILLTMPGAAASGTSVAALKSGPMVVLTQGNGPPRLLLPPAGSHPGPVGLDIVQYDDQGRIRFTGHAQANRTVRLYVNDHAVGDAVADAHGIWALSPGSDLPPGIYTLRTDELADDGKVIARSEVPFARASITQLLAPGQAVVQPGDCLWTIARHNYGRGIVYTAIFEENRDQIRDPRRIYPGQAFHMPTAEQAAHAPPLSALEPLLRAEHRTHGRHGARHARIS